MSKPYDTVTRFLHALDPDSWPRVLGIEAKSIEICNVDLSTVNSQVDLLLLIDKLWALHIENETSYKTTAGNRILEYSIFIGKALNVPVRSVLLLLRPEADGPGMTGVAERRLPNGKKYLDFQYEVVRIWKLPAEKLFKSSLGALPLAFIADIQAEGVLTLVKRAKIRLKRETDSKTASEIWTAISILLGLRYEREQVDYWLKGVREMEDSVTYQAIVEKGLAKGYERGIERGIEKGLEQGLEQGIEKGLQKGLQKGLEKGVLIGEKRGEAREARTILLKLGTDCFGEPMPRTLAQLNKIEDKSKLEHLIRRTRTVSSWTELLKK